MKMSFQKRLFSDAQSNFAFSLVELLVVLGISTVLTSIALSYMPSNQKRIILVSERAKVVGVLNRAKAFAFQGYKRDAPENCYGVHYEISANKQIIFKDLQCDGYNDGEQIETQFIDSRVEITTDSVSTIRFKPPYLEVLDPGNVILQLKSDTTNKVVVSVGALGDITMR